MVDVSDIYKERCFVAIDRDGNVIDDFNGRCNRIEYGINTLNIRFLHNDDVLACYSYHTIAGYKMVGCT